MWILEVELALQTCICKMEFLSAIDQIRCLENAKLFFGCSFILQGNCTENTAAKLEISREEQDEFAISSYKKTEAAWQVTHLSWLVKLNIK